MIRGSRKSEYSVIHEYAGNHLLPTRRRESCSVYYIFHDDLQINVTVGGFLQLVYNNRG
jgi:hypothetical protein